MSKSRSKDSFQQLQLFRFYSLNSSSSKHSSTMEFGVQPQDNLTKQILEEKITIPPHSLRIGFLYMYNMDSKGLTIINDMFQA